MATRVNIIIDQGTDFSTTVNLTDSSGTNLNLTGFSAASQIRKTHSSSNSTAFTLLKFFANAITDPPTLDVASVIIMFFFDNEFYLGVFLNFIY